MQNSRHLSYVFYSLKSVYECVTLALMCCFVPMLEGPGQQTDALVLSGNGFLLEIKKKRTFKLKFKY